MGTKTVDVPQYSRLSCRVNSRIKQQAEQAASLLGQSITDFTETALSEKAREVLEQHARITLSEKDFARFVAAIERPEPPTQQLRDAMTEYQRLKDTNPETNL